jgi:hypothetical protein
MLLSSQFQHPAAPLSHPLCLIRCPSVLSAAPLSHPLPTHSSSYYYFSLKRKYFIKERVREGYGRELRLRKNRQRAEAAEE